MGMTERVLGRSRWKVAAPEEDDDELLEDLEELDVAEYLIFLLALDTYMRYVHETAGPNVTDTMIRKGVTLIRTADNQQSDAIKAFLSGSLKAGSQQTMLDKAFRFVPNKAGLANRSFRLRTVLSRGGATTMRQVFKSNKALMGVRAAIAASTVENADAALDKFAALTMTNGRLRNWIDAAAKLAGSGEFQNAVAAATDQASDEDEELVRTSAERAGSPAASEQSANADAQRSDTLLRVEQDAAETAKRVMERSGEPDEPLTKSEVVGVATAVAKAVTTEVVETKNIPDALKSELTKHGPPDMEQVAAAMTDGRVLVAAGAGAGKSTTLVARIRHLVEDRKVPPSRIMASSFNAAAASELKEKVKKSLGSAGNDVVVGTMNALFRRFIAGGSDGFKGFGTPEEKAMMGPNFISPPGDKKKGERGGRRGPTPSTLSVAVRKMMSDCSAELLASHTGFEEEVFAEPPKAKQMNLYLAKWEGNDVSLEQARASATRKVEKQATVWYEFYMGLKGDPEVGRGWRPPCKESTAFDNFNFKYRKGDERLGDFSDQIKIMRDILRRDPRAKGAMQGKFDHFLVDEAQDLNTAQHQIFEMMTEQVTDGANGKSFWMVGDEKQSIYGFRGAKPEQFIGIHNKEGWKTRMIRTNYRCAPEIVDAANKLASHNEGGIPMMAQANPTKAREEASIRVEMTGDNASAAIATVGRIRKDLDDSDMDAEPDQYAVLARTNKELNDFETAAIINEIPYVRRGGNGFLDAPETKAILGYIDLATGTDYEKKAQSLVSVLLNPDHGLYTSPDKVEQAVLTTMDDIARRDQVDIKAVDPADIIHNSSRYARRLADNIKRPQRAQIISSMTRKGKPVSTGEWLYDKRVDELAEEIQGISPELKMVTDRLQDPDMDTPEMIDYILDNVTGTVRSYNPKTRKSEEVTGSLRDHIKTKVALFGGDDEGDAEGEEEEKQVKLDPDTGLPIAPAPTEGEGVSEDVQGKGLGAVQFLYALAEPNPNDLKEGNDPSKATGFQVKIKRFEEMAKKLRINPYEWRKKMIAEGKDPGTKPPALSLSTIHAVKGMEWDNVTVLMPKGKFPMERRPKPGEEPPPPEEAAADAKAERNLGYVALTRAAKNLEIWAQPDVKTGELSPFIEEAGLTIGENVPKENTGTEDIPMERTAGEDFTAFDTEVESDLLRFKGAQDRWQA